MIFQSFEIIDFFYQSKVQAKYISICKLIQLSISTLLKIFLMLTGKSLTWFVVLTLIDVITLYLSMLLFYLNQGNIIFFRNFDKKIAMQYLKSSWPLLFSGGVLMIQARIDQVMIKSMIGNSEVGQYSVAMRLIEVFGFIPMILQGSLFPSIQKSRMHSRELFLERLLNFYRLNFFLFIIIAVPIFFFAKVIVTTVFGIEYAPAGFLLALLSLRLLFANMGVARHSFILIENLTKFAMITMIIGTFFNVLLNYLLIPIYGAKGAIITSMISLFISTFAVDLFYSKTRNNVFLQFRSMLTFYKLNFGK